MSVVKSHTRVLLVAMQVETDLAMKMVIFYDPGMFYNCESPLRRCIIIPAINYEILIAQCSPVGYLSHGFHLLVLANVCSCGVFSSILQ